MGNAQEAAGWPRLGRDLARGETSLLVAAAAACVMVAFDLVVADSFPYELRVVPAVAVVLLFLLLARGNARSLGFRLRPAPSWRWWIRTLAVVAVALGLVLLACYAVGRALWGEIAVPRLFTPSTVGRWAVHAIVVAPLVEETIYRLVFLPPLVPWLGPWPAIALSGVAFAALHWIYGCPGPDNQVAGFVLAWAYVRSGCFWMPVLLHALGNALVLLVHLVLMEGWLHLPGVRLV